MAAPNRRLLAISMMGVSLACLARPAVGDTYVGPGPSSCAASAAVSGNAITVDLKVDRNGTPAKDSHVAHSPAGSHRGFSITAAYPVKADRSASTPAYVIADGAFERKDAAGGFVLTVGGRDFKALRPGVVLTGDPQLHGKAEVQQYFELTAPLLEALAAGGPGRLVYLDRKGATLAEADLSFAPSAVVWAAVDKAYPTALALATKKAQC